MCDAFRCLMKKTKMATAIEVTRTYLEMRNSSELRGAKLDDPQIRIEFQQDCSVELFRWLYTEVGRKYRWIDRLPWTDDEIRKYLARASTPHCIDSYGLGRYDVTDPMACPGTWASAVTPAPDRNTVLIYLTDNGWFLPNSKHDYTENGYRTRMIVFDPRTLPEVPGYHGVLHNPPPPNETPTIRPASCWRRRA